MGLARRVGDRDAAFAVGSPWGRFVVVAHGVAAMALLALVPRKASIIGRGLRRRGWGSWPSVLFLVLVAAAMLSGLAHSTGVAPTLGPVSAMQIHVGASLAALPLGFWHVRGRRVRLRPANLSRRKLLATAVWVGAAGLAWVAGESLVRALGLAGSRRRFTGSLEVGSLDPSAMPVTQWLADPVPAVDASTWRLTVGSGPQRRAWSYDELTGFGERLRAVTDCTGGWYSTQDWEGVRLDRLLPEPRGARSIAVRSVTGYTRRFPLSEAGSLFVATRLGGSPLPAGHGFPARLVAPGRRGFWSVNWLEGVKLDASLWWWQSPFPLQ